MSSAAAWTNCHRCGTSRVQLIFGEMSSARLNCAEELDDCGVELAEHELSYDIFCSCLSITGGFAVPTLLRSIAHGSPSVGVDRSLQ